MPCFPEEMGQHLALLACISEGLLCHPYKMLCLATALASNLGGRNISAALFGSPARTEPLREVLLCLHMSPPALASPESDEKSHAELDAECPNFDLLLQPTLRSAWSVTEGNRGLLLVSDINSVTRVPCVNRNFIGAGIAFWHCSPHARFSNVQVVSSLRERRINTNYLGVLGLDAVLELCELLLLQRTNLRLSALPLCTLPGLQQLLPAPACHAVLTVGHYVGQECRSAVNARESGANLWVNHSTRRGRDACEKLLSERCMV